jgi:hypothetical protein
VSNDPEAENPVYLPRTPAEPDVVDGIEVEPHITEYFAFGLFIYLETSMFADVL